MAKGTSVALAEELKDVPDSSQTIIPPKLDIGTGDLLLPLSSRDYSSVSYDDVMKASAAKCENCNASNVFNASSRLYVMESPLTRERLTVIILSMETILVARRRCYLNSLKARTYLPLSRTHVRSAA